MPYRTKTALKSFAAEIARKRREVSRLRENLGDMLDHLAVIEARVKSAGGKRYSTARSKEGARDLTRVCKQGLACFAVNSLTAL